MVPPFMSKVAGWIAMSNLTMYTGQSVDFKLICQADFATQASEYRLQVVRLMLAALNIQHRCSICCVNPRP